jgi:hypothetical protein
MDSFREAVHNSHSIPADTEYALGTRSLLCPGLNSRQIHQFKGWTLGLRSTRCRRSLITRRQNQPNHAWLSSHDQATT